jgi:NADH:ubiquinone reductase (H+-translocating)
MSLKINEVIKLGKPASTNDNVASAQSNQQTQNPTTRPRVIPRVVVVGAGFGGLNVARNLADKEVDVLIVDKNNYHGFWPLLYQVATAGLEPSSIAYPVRAIIRKHKNVQFQMAEVKRVDFENKQVITNGEPLPYDYLVLAAGSTTNYFGNNNLQHNTYGLKDLDEAVKLRNHVLSCFEQAVRETDPVHRKALLTFVLVGAGPTGVELAGAFAELIRHVIRKDYPMLDVSQAVIMLVEAGGHVLPPFHDSLRHSALRQLESLGVEVRLNTLLDTVEGETVRFKDGTQFQAGTVVWAAGVRAATLADTLGATLARQNRVPVTPSLNLAEYPEVFVIGDMAHLESYKGNQAHPMVAQVAIQQGKLAAKNILACTRRGSLKAFHYNDKGSMATIGRRSAVFDAFGVRLTGMPAWFSWMGAHLLFLIGFRNRLIVMANWIYNYFTYDRGVRLIDREKM